MLIKYWDVQKRLAKLRIQVIDLLVLILPLLAICIWATANPKFWCPKFYNNCPDEDDDGVLNSESSVHRTPCSESNCNLFYHSSRLRRPRESPQSLHCV